MPKLLIAVLGDLGIQAKTAIAQGWNELTNGRLVSAAVAQGFSCLLTRDQLAPIIPIPGKIVHWPA